MFNKVQSLIIVLLFGCASALSISSFADSPTMIHIVKYPGIFPSPNGKCEASLETNKMGGFLTLYVSSKSDKRNIQTTNDITGLVWISDDKLVYTVSPIYGRPGIFLFNCVSKKKKRILGPKTINKSYPAGADFFELEGFSSKANNVILFYYASDVDLVDFSKFRSKEFLYQVDLNGKGFKKVPQNRELKQKM